MIRLDWQITYDVSPTNRHSSPFISLYLESYFLSFIYVEIASSFDVFESFQFSIIYGPLSYRDLKSIFGCKNLEWFGT